ncbi:MAG: hypothetical protein EXR99_02060 [Gemmataceae bacterium]|nr:hypothetical protein [Gemmataceae bacterium]
MRNAILAFSLFLLPGSSATASSLTDRNPYSVSLVCTFSGQPPLSALRQDLLSKSLESQLQEGLDGLVQVKQHEILLATEFATRIQKPGATFDKVFFISIQSEARGFSLTIQVADQVGGILFLPQSAKVATPEQIVPEATRLIVDMFGTRGKILEKGEGEKVKGVLKAGLAARQEKVLVNPGDYLLVFRRSRESAIPVYKKLVVEVGEIAFQEGSWKFSGKLLAGIAVPALDELEVMRIPRGGFPINFQLDIRDGNSQGAGTYFPMEIRLHKKGFEGPLLFHGQTSPTGAFTAESKFTRETQGVVFVEVSKENRVLGQFPFFALNEKKDTIALRWTPAPAYENQLATWKAELDDHLGFLRAAFREINQPALTRDELIAKARKAKKFHQFSTDRRNRLSQEISLLKEQFPEVQTSAECLTGLKKIQNANLFLEELHRFVLHVGELEISETIQEDNTLKLAEARQLAREGEFPKAIAILAALSQPDALVKKNLANYRNIWEGKSAQVQLARQFFLEQFKNTSMARLGENSSMLISHLDTCVQEKDLAGPAIFLRNARELLLKWENDTGTGEKATSEVKQKALDILDTQIQRVQKFFELEIKKE